MGVDWSTIGAVASQLAAGLGAPGSQASNTGQAMNQLFQAQIQNDKLKKAREEEKKSKWKNFGSQVLGIGGSIAGGMVGGPVGAAVGGSIGSVGGQAAMGGGGGWNAASFGESLGPLPAALMGGDPLTGLQNSAGMTASVMSGGRVSPSMFGGNPMSFGFGGGGGQAAQTMITPTQTPKGMTAPSDAGGYAGGRPQGPVAPAGTPSALSMPSRRDMRQDPYALEAYLQSGGQLSQQQLQQAPFRAQKALHESGRFQNTQSPWQSLWGQIGDGVRQGVVNGAANSVMPYIQNGMGRVTNGQFQRSPDGTMVWTANPAPMGY